MAVVKKLRRRFYDLLSSARTLLRVTTNGYFSLVFRFLNLISFDRLRLPVICVRNNANKALDRYDYIMGQMQERDDLTVEECIRLFSSMRWMLRKTAYWSEQLFHI